MSDGCDRSDIELH
jgi:hypothetical protein